MRLLVLQGLVHPVNICGPFLAPAGIDQIHSKGVLQFCGKEVPMCSPRKPTSGSKLPPLRDKPHISLTPRPSGDSTPPLDLVQRPTWALEALEFPASPAPSSPSRCGRSSLLALLCFFNLLLTLLWVTTRYYKKSWKMGVSLSSLTTGRNKNSIWPWHSCRWGNVSQCEVGKIGQHFPGIVLSVRHRMMGPYHGFLPPHPVSGAWAQSQPPVGIKAWTEHFPHAVLPTVASVQTTLVSERSGAIRSATVTTKSPDAARVPCPPDRLRAASSPT